LNPGPEPGSDPGLDPGSNPSSDPGSNPGSDPGFILSLSHPELLADIRTLQRELKELEQKFGKAQSDDGVFAASRQRAKSSFFAIMRPRLRKQNPAKYVDRSALDRDLMILQQALKNKVPLEETYD